MNKNKILSMLLIIILLCFPSIIIASDPITLNDMKIQYMHINSSGEVEFGEIHNGQELALLLRYYDTFLVRIWNYTDDDLFLDNDQPINIIEGQDYIKIYIEEDNVPWIPKVPQNSCLSFWIVMMYHWLYDVNIMRYVIEIKSQNSEDEDFIFGLWQDLSC